MPDVADKTEPPKSVNNKRNKLKLFGIEVISKPELPILLSTLIKTFNKSKSVIK